MPAVYRNTQDHTTVMFWAITESEEQLRSLVSAQDIASAGRFGSPARRIEHLAWRAALRQIIGDAEVSYNDAGAPYIKSDDADAANIADALCTGSGMPRMPDTSGGLQNIYLSAAHTRGMAAVMVSYRPCAIDTESVVRNLERTSARFISPAERTLPVSSDPEFPVTVWCAKEALYKFSGRRELDFLTDLQITAVDPVAGNMTGRIAEIQGIKLNILRFDGYIAVYIKS